MFSNDWTLKSLSNIDRLFIELEILGENKMSELKLYTFFCVEYQEINTPIIEVIIDRSLNFIGDITEYIGQHVYKYYPYDNPIFPGNKYYFGGTSADAFLTV